MEKLSPSSISTLLYSLWRHLNLQRRKQFSVLLMLMLITSFTEVLSIGAVLPFLGMLTNSRQIFEVPLMRTWANYFGITTHDQLLFLVAFFFGLSALAVGAMRLLLLWSSTRLSFGVGADLCTAIYRRTLYQSYEVHISRNSSEIINGILSKIGAVIAAINSSLNLVSSFLILVTIILTLIFIDSFVALLAFVGFGSIYIGIFWLTQKRQLEQSYLIARESTQVVKLLQEGLGGIRDILIDGTQETFCHLYQTVDSSLRRAQGNIQFISLCPRYGMESLGIVLIIVLSIILVEQDNGAAKAIPILGALALGLQRCLPLLQSIYHAWSSIQGSQASLEDALQLLSQPLSKLGDRRDSIPLSFASEISLHALAYRYSKQSPWIFKNINLKIPKGSRTGFIGPTGAGKSTLLDVVMGLLDPTDGDLQVDGIPINAENKHMWQSHIAHVPQNIFLADASIKENIAFGLLPQEIDFERVLQVARQAQIAKTIEGWENGYETAVGERGVRLSGGQRQRIGIARALYKNADVIVFDEATSALDDETERDVMEAIDGLDKNLTILIIAHRTSTLKNCDLVLELSNGSISYVSN